MSEEVHEAYIKQLLEAHQVPQVTVAWQGGEPTLMGLISSNIQLSSRESTAGQESGDPCSRITNQHQSSHQSDFGMISNPEFAGSYLEVTHRKIAKSQN
jgi:sulfatase maturation enzyme AslB (radical SAM superfamily)